MWRLPILRPHCNVIFSSSLLCFIHQQAGRFKRFQLGYDFLTGTGVAVLKKVDENIQKVINKVARETSKMFLFAIEGSGSGPPKGIMNLDKNDKGGTVAFLRALQNFLSVQNPPTYSVTIRDGYEEVDIPISGSLNEDWKNSYQQNEMDGSFMICRTLITPLVLFLHVDQGSFDKVGYTPLASPVTNSRSVNKNHLDKVTREILDGKSIVSMEDFAIIGYQVFLNEEPVPESEEARPIEYKCTLNRDNANEEKVVAKKLTLVTKDNLERIFKTVSYNMSCYVRSTNLKANSLCIDGIAISLSPQLFGTSLSKEDLNADVHMLFAEYLNTLRLWIDTHFNGLQTMENWKKFYIYLAQEVCGTANMKAVGERRNDKKIDSDYIAFPKNTDIIHVCRLLFQTLVNLRVGMADGQHRICAMMNLLSGWSVTVNTKTVPPKTFQHGDHFGIVDYNKTAGERDEEVAEKINLILPIMYTKVSVRTVLCDDTATFESFSVKYSQVRLDSQAKHKPRVLVDV
jgi:hypothetical protein